MEEQSRLLADIRELTVEMESPRLSLQDQSYLKLCADILKQVRADGVPDYPITEHIKSRYGSEQDNGGQTVIYLDDAPSFTCAQCHPDEEHPDVDYCDECVSDYSERCHSCGEPFEIQVEDGEACLECQAG